MIRYVVTTFADSTGANLSREGEWGNVPYTSAAAAREAARIDAAGQPHTIRQEAAKPRRKGA